MSYIRLANFFQIYSVNAAGEKLVQECYNNNVPGQSLLHDGRTYQYLSFIYQGASKNRTGDNLEAQLLLSVNNLSSNRAVEAVTKREHVRMFSAVMRENGTVERVLAKEEWLAASLSYDNETLEIILSSAIDAVGANAPTRVLTRELVGNLPVTGNIQTR